LLKHLDWPHIKQQVREAVIGLPHFFKNPVEGMRTLPQWDWPTTLIIQGVFAATCSILANILQRDVIGTFTAIIIAPLAAYLTVAITAGFFYYVFLFFFHREIPYRGIYQHLVFASFAVWIVNIVASLIPPVSLIGAIAAAMLLYVGFVENFSLDRKKVRKLLAGLMVIYAVVWTFQLVRSTSRHENMRIRATPESLDILEKELGK
jgi:hypothetical protein